MSNYLESNKRIYVTMGILASLMLMIIVGIYPSNYEQLFVPANRLTDICIWGSVLAFFLVLFSKKQIPGEKTVGTIKYFALVATLGIAGAFFAYCAAPEFIDAYGVDSTVILMDWFGLTVWATYVPFTILELYDQEGKLPKWLSEVKRYVTAISIVLAIAISMMAIGNTIPKLCNQMFGWEVNPYAVLILIAGLTALSLFRGINKGMGVFSVTAMIMMVVVLLFLIVKSFTGHPFEYMLNESVAYFLALPSLHNYQGTEFHINCHYNYFSWMWCWSLLIGKFMVTLSKGRSLRLTCVSVTLIPTIVCFLYILISRYAFIQAGESYGLLAQYPIIGVIYIIMIGFMFITSADSSAYSIDQEISRGQKATNNYRKLLWVVVILVFTTTILIIGGHTGDALYAIDYLASPILLLVCIAGLGIGFYKDTKLKFQNKQSV